MSRLWFDMLYFSRRFCSAGVSQTSSKQCCLSCDFTPQVRYFIPWYVDRPEDISVRLKQYGVASMNSQKQSALLSLDTRCHDTEDSAKNWQT